MGILNVTPDSFSDGGRHFDPAAAVARAKTMVAEGAAIVDVGGESTRPGHAPVSEEEELRRVAPVLEALAAELDAPISIDTSKAAVAREAARLGASVINDVWGLQRDPGMADAVAENGLGRRRHAQPRDRGSGDRHPRRRRALLRALAQARGARRRAVRPHSARSRRRLRQDARAEPRLHLESRPVPPIRSADPRRAVAQVVHRPDRGRRSGRAPRRHAGRRHGRADARRLRAAGARRRRAPSGARRLPGARGRRAAAAPQRAATGAPTSSLRSAATSATRRARCAAALAALDDEPGVALTAVSRFYRTPPWGKTDQDWFVNACALAGPTLRRKRCSTGSRRSRRRSAARPPSDGARASSTSTSSPTTTSTLETDRLTLPHPELFNRAFVLVPLAEIAPERVIGGRRVEGALADLGAEGDGRRSTGLNAPKRAMVRKRGETDGRMDADSIDGPA